MKKADRKLVTTLHKVITDAAPTDLGERQMHLVIPDSPYSPEPISAAVMLAAAKGIPHVHVVLRYYATADCPFDGWCVTFRGAA